MKQKESTVMYVLRLAGILLLICAVTAGLLAGDCTGTVVNCHLLTANGQEVTVNDDGTFSCTISLQAGENTVQIVARDSLGNSSAYNASIFSGAAAAVPGGGEQTMPGGFFEVLTGGYWMLLIVSALGALVVVYALVYWRKGERK